MAGERQGELKDLLFAPGFVTNQPDRDAQNRWKDGDRVRFTKGLPQKKGGSLRLALTGELGTSDLYLGECRALHDWSSLDGQRWIGMGTHKKLYNVSNSKLYDITPKRRTVNLVNPFTTTNGSSSVRISDPDHRAEPGDYIRIFDATAVGGLTIDGRYVIDTVTPNTYTITAASNASSGATGGGSVTIEYDIYQGLPYNGELTGFGTGTYGTSTYGTPRQAGQGVQAKMRIWSLDNWGEDLLGSYNGGPIFWWDRTTGPFSRATVLENAPQDCQRILVNAESGFVIAIGCSDTLGNPDRMRVAWCEQSDFFTWLSVANADDPNIASAGGKRLDSGSILITGIKTRSGNMIWSDTTAYWMEFLPGDANVFGFRPLGACKIVGPNAAIDANGVVYFWAFDNFYVYDGTLRILPCDVWTKVFNDWDKTQAEMVYAGRTDNFSEIIWYYPANDGLKKNNRYVIYNTESQTWVFGTGERSAYHDASNAIGGVTTNPYAVANGKFYIEEDGTDDVDGATTTVAPWFLESWDINVGSSDRHGLVNKVAPNFDDDIGISGSMLMTLKKKNYPRQLVYQTKGPYTITETTQLLGVRCRASQIALRLESAGVAGEDFRLGIFQWNIVPYGKRAGRMTQGIFVGPGAPTLEGSLVPFTGEISPVLTSGPDEGSESAALNWEAADFGDSHSVAFYDIYAASSYPSIDFGGVDATLDDLTLVGTVAGNVLTFNAWPSGLITTLTNGLQQTAAYIVVARNDIETLESDLRQISINWP